MMTKRHTTTSSEATSDAVRRVREIADLQRRIAEILSDAARRTRNLEEMMAKHGQVDVFGAEKCCSRRLAEGKVIVGWWIAVSSWLVRRPAAGGGGRGRAGAGCDGKADGWALPPAGPSPALCVRPFTGRHGSSACGVRIAALRRWPYGRARRTGHRRGSRPGNRQVL